MAIEPGRYFDDTEIMTHEAREKFQNENLYQTAGYAYRNSPFTRNLLDKADIRPFSIRALKDLEQVPITRKNDLIEAEKANPPFGGLLAVPVEDIERIFISPGPIYEFQPSGIQWFARSMWAAGFRKGDIVVNTFTYHLSPAGTLFHEGLRRCGATVVVMGTGNTDILIKALLDLRVTGFVGTPTFLMTVIKRAEEMGYNFTEQFAVKKTWFTGEMLPPSMRQVFEEKYHLSTSQAYAVTEPGGAIAYECQEKSGLHLMDDYVVEIVDPQTGKQLGPGEVGEIVVTPIHNRSWGLIRFGTGDMSSLITSPCSCGRTASKISGIVGRSGDAVKVRGMFIVAKQAEQVIGSFAQVAKFQIVVDRQGDRDVLNLKIELKTASLEPNKLSAELDKKFQDICRVKPDSIEFISAGTIPEVHKTIEDIRKWN
jgi:phenylacetate-CoA ligase